MRITRRKGIVIAGMALVVTALFVLTSSPFQQWLLRRAQLWAADAGFPFSAARLRLDFSDLTASLDDLVFDQNGQRIQVKRLNIDLPWNALREGLRITNLEADGVSVSVRSTDSSPEDGTKTSPTAAKRPRIRIDHVAIRNASFTYSSPSTTVTVPSFSLEATDGRGTIRLDSPASLGPQTQITAGQIPVVVEDDNIRFGAASWGFQHATYRGSGSIQGVVRLTPTVGLETEVTTDPLTLQKWDGIRAHAVASYTDGVLDVREFRLARGSGEISGSAQVSRSGNSASITWKDLSLDPRKAMPRTNGALKLAWQRSDLHDLSAEGQAEIHSAELGLLKTDIRIAERNAVFDIRTRPFDFAVRAQLSMGLERLLNGDVREFRGTVRGSVQPIAADSPYRKLGIVNVSAAATFRDNVLAIQQIQAKSKRSAVSGAALTVNLTTNQILGNIPNVQVDLQDVTPDAFGSVDLSGTIDGTVAQPTATFSGTSMGLNIRNVPIDQVRLEGMVGRSSSGALELSSSLSGTAHPLSLLKTSGPYFQGLESIRVSGRAAFSDNILVIHDIQAQSQTSRLEDATLQINLTDKQIQGSARRIQADLSDIASETKGTIELFANVDGTINQSRVLLEGSSAGVDVMGTHIDSIDLEGKFADNSFVVTRLNARQADGVLDASGDIDFTTENIGAKAVLSGLKIDQIPNLTVKASMNAQVSGTYKSPRIDFDGEFRDLIYQDQEHGVLRFEGTTDLKKASIRADSGKYTADLVGEVALEPPFLFTGVLKANQSHIAYEKYNFVADGKVHLSGEAQPFKANDVRFDTFTLRGEGVDLSASGPLRTGSQVDLKIDLDQLPVEGVDLKGTATGSAIVSGDINNPSVKGVLTTEGATVLMPQMSEPAEVSAHINFTGSDVSIQDLRAKYAGASATITGSGTWQGTGKINFQIADIRPENFAPGKSVSGLARVEGELDVQSPRLEGISGYARVTELGIKVRDAEVRQTQPIEVELRNQILSVRQFEIKGLDTYARVTGHADLRDRTLQFDADADTDLAILEPFIPNSHPDGRVKTRVAVRGTTEKPSLEGNLSISEGELQIENPDVLLTDFDVEVQLRENRIEINRATGVLNGGKFEASGGAGITAAGLQDAKVNLKAERAQLEYPDGFQSEFTMDLVLAGTMPNLTLGGKVEVLNAIYQKDIKLTQQIFARITSPSRMIGAATPPGIGEQIRMEVEVETDGPIVVKNNVADLETSGTFQIRGTAANPILLGRATVAEGGELYFGPTITGQDTTQRSDRYTIERGFIDFNNRLRTEPELDFRATHELEIEDERYLITLEVTGTPETLKPVLTSDPHLDQNDIVTMLLTGRKWEELQGTYANFAGEQALGYVSGQLSDRVLNQAGQFVGLNTVRIDPVAVADQTDLAARITVAKEITDEFSLIYSHNLNDAKSQTWIASYKPFQNLVFRGINDTDEQEAVLDLKHDLRLGGGDAVLKRKRRDSEIRLRNATFTGTHFAEKDLLKQITKEGEPYAAHRVSLDVRNIRRFLASQGYPQARIRAQQSTEARQADVRFDITEGVRIVLAYEGVDVPESLQKEIQQIWTLRSSDAASLRDSTARLLRHFRSEGYLQARITVDDPVAMSDGRRYIFRIEPGAEFEKPTWVFHGIEPISIPEPAGVVMENPEVVKENIESHLRSDAYLDAKSSVPTLVLDGVLSRFEVTVVRGSRYTVEAIEFEGNQALNSQQLSADTTTEKSARANHEPVYLTSQWLDGVQQRITSEYWKHGFNDVEVIPSTTPVTNAGQAKVQFTIVEGELQRIEAIEITGYTLTSRAFIERQFEFRKGDPVDHTKVNLTRKNLYDTRLFKRVEIEMVPGPIGYTARVVLTENAPWQLRYGVAVTEHLDTGERNTGFAADLTYNNFLGRGIIAGFSGKIDANERDGRVFGSLPRLFGRKVTTSVTVFRTKEEEPEEEIVDYWGGTIQQQWRFGKHYLLSYDYSLRRVLEGERTLEGRDNEDDDDTVLDDPRIPIARFDATISRDTRDDILNAKRGTFLSNSFEIAPPGIGSSIEFLRNYSQFLHFQPLKKFVVASAIRFGVAKPLTDQTLDSTLQFRTGGSTTVRAFEHDELTTAPGNYELILNSELRFPIFWKFSGVTFFDAGQVAVTSKDLFKFRYGPGIGIRIDTPFIMLRTDLGLNVSPRPGEAMGRWWFGIGQAF